MEQSVLYCIALKMKSGHEFDRRLNQELINRVLRQPNPLLLSKEFSSRAGKMIFHPHPLKHTHTHTQPSPQHTATTTNRHTSSTAAEDQQWLNYFMAVRVTAPSTNLRPKSHIMDMQLLSRRINTKLLHHPHPPPPTPPACQKKEKKRKINGRIVA